MRLIPRTDWLSHPSSFSTSLRLPAGQPMWFDDSAILHPEHLSILALTLSEGPSGILSRPFLNVESFPRFRVSHRHDFSYVIDAVNLFATGSSQKPWFRVEAFGEILFLVASFGRHCEVHIKVFLEFSLFFSRALVPIGPWRVFAIFIPNCQRILRLRRYSFNGQAGRRVPLP